MRRLDTLAVASCWVVLGLLGCSKSRAESEASAPIKASPAVSATAAAAGDSRLKSCSECEQASACAELTNPCQKFSGEAATQCKEVQACVQRTGCAQGEHSFTSCYCGPLGTAKCLEAPLSGAGAPQGACRDVIAGAYSTLKNNTELLTRYIEPEYPGGAALARLNCLKLNCNRECSFDKPTPAAAGPAAP